MYKLCIWTTLHLAESVLIFPANFATISNYLISVTKSKALTTLNIKCNTLSYLKKEWKRKSIFLLLLNSLSIFNSLYSFKMYLSILTRSFLKICVIHQSVIIHFPTVIYFQLTAWFSHAREERHKSVLSQ